MLHLQPTELVLQLASKVLLMTKWGLDQEKRCSLTYSDYMDNLVMALLDVH